MIWVENILRFVIVMLLQLLLFNNLHFMGICTPCVYVLFLLALPAETPNWVEQLLAFFTGLVMDIFCNTPGVNTAACVAVGFLRPKLIHQFVPDDDRLIGSFGLKTVDFGVFVRVLVLLVLLHHSILFSFANFTWHNWWLTLLQIIVSSVATIALALVWEVLSNR